MLQPSFYVQIKGFEDVKLALGTFDLSINMKAEVAKLQELL